jgi:3-oxoacyl-[acyl-carrier-protein] synthase-3
LLIEGATEYIESSVTGVGSYRPDRVVTNDEVVETTNVDADWVLLRTGIEQRRFSEPSESVASMAIEAGLRALSSAQQDAASLALVIVCSSTNHRSMPGVAAEVAYGVGAINAGCFDLNAVCAGFSYGLAQAAATVREHRKPVLVIGSEKLSMWLDPADAGTRPIFADGAGAFVLAPSETRKISLPVWGNDGSRSELIRTTGESSFIEMKGPLVYKWATSVMPKIIGRICDQAGLELSQVDWLVLHQANRRIIDAIAASVGFPADRVARDVVLAGNTSSASIPLAVDALISSGRALSGESALLLGFGSGLSYSGQIIQIP